MAQARNGKNLISPLFIDTSDPQAIETYLKMGVISGVTTNPTIMFKEKFATNEREVKQHSLKLAKLINPFPLSLEVTSNDPKEMIAEAKVLASWAKNIVIKVPVHGPAGELYYLEVIHKLSNSGIKINCTAIMSPIQGLMAALAGASYVSLFGGRVANIGHDAANEYTKLRTLLDMHAPEAKIIGASTREAYNVTDWLLAGCDIVTVVPSLMEICLVHPYTKDTVQMFLNDGAKLKGK
jgi:transaldolase